MAPLECFYLAHSGRGLETSRMSFCKLYHGCAILFIIFTVMLCEHQKITFKYVRCNGTEEYFFNLSCYAKSYSRNFSTMNFIIYSKKSVNAAFVSWKIILLNECLGCYFPKWIFSVSNATRQAEVKLFYKYGTIYREVMHTPVLDWCALMDNKFDNKMWATLLQVIKESAGTKIIHSCPYTVSFMHM